MGAVQHSLSGVFHSRGTGLRVSVCRYNEDIPIDIDQGLFPYDPQLKKQ